MRPILFETSAAKDEHEQRLDMLGGLVRFALDTNQSLNGLVQCILWKYMWNAIVMHSQNRRFDNASALSEVGFASLLWLDRKEEKQKLGVTNDAKGEVARVAGNLKIMVDEAMKDGRLYFNEIPLWEWYVARIRATSALMRPELATGLDQFLSQFLDKRKFQFVRQDIQIAVESHLRERGLS